MKDMTGLRFANLTVLRRIPSKLKRVFWLCLCDCGKETRADGAMLRSGRKLSCGCKRGFKHGAVRGGTKTPEYQSYSAAKSRCNNKNHRCWYLYGGRGIKFNFESFNQFIAELGPKPSPQHTVDRINNEGNYEPGNVRWATKLEQARNSRKYKQYQAVKHVPILDSEIEF